jgi:hypothetical protein
VLCLTYFESTCEKYLGNAIQLLISLTYTLAQIKKNSMNVASQQMTTCSTLLISHFKSTNNDPNAENLRLLVMVFEGVLQYRRGSFSRAKGLFSELISCLTASLQS